MDQTLIFNPIVTPSIVAILASLAALGAVIWQRGAILTAIGGARARLFTRTGFFWTVIAAFMAVSVAEGGAFFSVTGDFIGYGIALFLDLVTVVLMHAQLEARYRGEHIRANTFIVFIAMTCGLSTYANLAMTTNTFTTSMLKNSPTWIQISAPYALASPPILVIMMSIASELIINVRPLDQLEEEDYEADEMKRVRLLEIRYQYAIKQQKIEAEKEAERQRIKAQRAQQQAEHRALMKQIGSEPEKSTQITAPQPQAVSEQNTDALEALQIQAAINRAEEEPVSNQPEIVKEPKRDCQYYRSQGQTNLTVQETASLCDTSEQVIRSLCTKDKLKHPSPNSQLITLASIEVYLHNRKPNARNRKQSTASMPVIEITTNEEATNNTASIDRLLATASAPKFSSNGHNTKETVKLDELEEAFA